MLNECLQYQNADGLKGLLVVYFQIGQERGHRWGTALTGKSVARLPAEEICRCSSTGKVQAPLGKPKGQTMGGFDYLRLFRTSPGEETLLISVGQGGGF